MMPTKLSEWLRNFDKTDHAALIVAIDKVAIPEAEQLEAENERLKQQNGLMRQRLRYYGAGLIKEADKFDALEEGE